MNENFQLKIKIIVSAILLGILVLLGVFFSRFIFVKDSPKIISSEYKRIITENDLGKNYHFRQELSENDSIYNINTSSQVLKKELLQRALIIGYSEGAINNDFKEVEKQIAKKKYARSLELTKKSIDSSNLELENYNHTYEETSQEIKKPVKKYLDRGATLINIRVFGSWAVATIAPGKLKTDPVNVVFKKEGGIWQVAEGPGSHLDKKVLVDSGAPQEIINNSNTVLSVNHLVKIKL